MSEFSDLLEQGFGAMLDVTRDADGKAAATLTRGEVTKPCISTPIGESKEMREVGYWPKFSCVAELLRADFDALDLADRVVVKFRDRDRDIFMKVIGMEPDPADPCIKVTLKEEPAPAR